MTGGSRGIGEGCVRVFFEAGANVLFCSNMESDGMELVAELLPHAKDGQRIVFVPADISKIDDIQRVIDQTVNMFGHIDCLINNAGWHPPPKTIDEFTIEDMQDLFQLNFVSYYAACKFALPHLRKAQGNIINMGSWVGINGQALAPTYAATKGATAAFSKALAIDEAVNNVRINIVSPGSPPTSSTPLHSTGIPCDAIQCLPQAPLTLGNSRTRRVRQHLDSVVEGMV